MQWFCVILTRCSSLSNQRPSQGLFRQRSSLAHLRRCDQNKPPVCPMELKCMQITSAWWWGWWWYPSQPHKPKDIFWHVEKILVFEDIYWFHVIRIVRFEPELTSTLKCLVLRHETHLKVKIKIYWTLFIKHSKQQSSHVHSVPLTSSKMMFPVQLFL